MPMPLPGSCSGLNEWVGDPGLVSSDAVSPGLCGCLISPERLPPPRSGEGGLLVEGGFCLALAVTAVPQATEDIEDMWALAGAPRAAWAVLPVRVDFPHLAGVCSTLHQNTRVCFPVPLLECGRFSPTCAALTWRGCPRPNTAACCAGCTCQRASGGSLPPPAVLRVVLGTSEEELKNGRRLQLAARVCPWDWLRGRVSRVLTTKERGR